MTTHEIYTIGYGNDPPQAFLDRLVAAEIELVIDVRRKGSRARLGCYAPSESPEKGMPVLLATRDIDYRWAWELGNPFLVTGERPMRDCLNAYTSYLYMALSGDYGWRDKGLQKVAYCVAWECERSRTAILCAEKSVVKGKHRNCHRGIVAELVARWLNSDRAQWPVIATRLDKDEGEWSVVHL